MKLRISAICILLMASLAFVAVTPVAAEPNYDLVKYDPIDDVLRMRAGGDFKFFQHDNVDITKMTSRYISGLIPQIELTMQVEGTIQNSDDYKYAFVVLADEDEYIFGAYQNGDAVGFRLGSNQLILSVTATGEGTNTLTITFNEASIGSPDSSFEFSGAAIYSVGDYERYVDLAQPDKLILITEPSDGSTVSGSRTVRGVIRDSIESQPSGTVKIKIDSGNWEDVTGSDPWSYNLDTTTLSSGKHTISVKVDGSNLENVEDQIEITVDQNMAGYDSFDQKPAVHVGDTYHYETLGTPKISGINLDISNEMDVVIEDFVEIDVDGTDYETYVMHTTSEGSQDLGYFTYENTMDRTSWREKTEFSSVKDYIISVVTVDFRQPTTVETWTTYDPPMENHNYYDVTVGFGNIWSFLGSSDSESQTTIGDGQPTSNPPYSDSFEITGECLYHLASITVHGNTYNDIFVIRSYYENPGVSVIEFYSPELGVPVRIDTFDPSRDLLFSLGLQSWEQMPFSVVIEDVTFDPAEPEADSTAKITVDVRNVGGEEAKNIKVTIRDGTRQVAQETIASIAMDTTEPLTVDWTPDGEGNHSIKVTVSAGSKDLDEKTVYVDVKPGVGGDGDSMFMILLLIVIVAIVAVVLVVMLMARKKKSAGEIPAAEGQEAAVQPQEGPGVVVATEEVAAEPVQLAAVTAVQPAPAAAQVFQENIKCPSCQNAFSVKFQSKPVRVKCPTCGTEGVLN